ncbi:putative ATP-dependent protease (CrgA) [Aspergillus tanneri]|uniref:ATP-dependent protease (CrgA) n=1 Tax=Aspergillus tanneri TaxID=1220188 RepID=A0A5M9MTW8_9EURO|nr:uncharacterized protein ATNIH1004_003248 [Aspergillus tanneri]KAA8650561.1 hypothetical protein ATNIH1004_003248 [Aspergillus tanneri]
MDTTSPHYPQTDDSHLHALNTVPTPRSNRVLSSPPHDVVRLIQCFHCSQPLRAPLRLPCGNAVCRACLPPIHRRTGITYPANEDRKQGFTCLWEGIDENCAGEHCVADCGGDILLARLVDVFEEVLGASSTTVQGGFRVIWHSIERDTGKWIEKSSTCQGRGLLEGIYDLAKRGLFDYDASEVKYELDGHVKQDDGVLSKLMDAMQSELDCHVCYSPIVDPLTTSCGHTFCRGCVIMIMNHSDLCPVCRRKLNVDSTVHVEPSNQRIAGLLETLFPEQTASRREAVAQEGADTDNDETKLPLFVSSLSLPTVPTFLHIFEPRYRLMMRRVMRSRNHQFGMIIPNRGGRSQGVLGRSRFMQYGTVVVVERYEPLPDGRSLVIVTGQSRFKVLGSEFVDGYHIGRIQRVNDMSITEEERQESMETSALSGFNETNSSDKEKALDAMSTQELFDVGQNFVRQQHSQGAAWLQPRVLLAYGGIPDDAARFPWWFASVLPIWEEEKYELLPTTSQRMRGHEPKTYISQSVVVGAFLAILMVQVATNAGQVLRTRWRERQSQQRVEREQESPQPTSESPDEAGLNEEPARDAG